MKTIATFSTPEEAHLFRMRLEAVEIPAFVFDENIVQLDWLYSNAIGGVRVQVNEEDMADAKGFVMADKGEQSNDGDNVVCPSCGSRDIAHEDPLRRAAYALVLFTPLLMLLGPFMLSSLRKREWQCRACSHAFKPPTSGGSIATA